jgi:hypothetical protein
MPTYYDEWQRWCRENNVVIPESIEAQCWEFHQWMKVHNPQA